MILLVNPHKIELKQEETVNEKEVNISECEFIFNDEITNEFVKEAYFTLEDKTYKQIIINNKCKFPQEVLIKPGTITLGVVAYYIEDDEELVRYNPTPVYFKTDLGSLKNAENSEPITPSEMEQFEQEMQEEINQATTLLTPTIGENDNWFIGGNDTGKPSKGTQGDPGTPGQDGFSPTATVTKSGNTATITITDKNGTTTSNISDGEDGRDGAIQYTAGDNIIINENNVISASVSSVPTYYLDIGVDASLYTFDVNFSQSGKDNLGAILTDAYSKNYRFISIMLVNTSGKFPFLLNCADDSSKYDITAKPTTILFNSSNTITDGRGLVINRYTVRATVTWNNNIATVTAGKVSKKGVIVVELEKDQTITSKKTFSTLPESSVIPTTDDQLTNKKYVDDSITSAITTTLGGSY